MAKQTKQKKIKDFDKDTMYRKLMPSAEQEKPAHSAPVEDPGAAEQRAPGGFVLHNYMEEMVRDKLDHTAKVLEACGCDRCRKDIIALALNQLPAAYAVVEKPEEHLRKLKASYEVKVTTALIKAIQQVKKSPRHGER